MKPRIITLGGSVQIDVEKLIVSRLLVQADSGGGKSWCMRRIFEQTHPFAQQIIIDPEGEFSTLREKFDYVLAAKQGGDVIATPRYAEMFAHRLLELKVSAIIDLFDLKPDERIAYIKEFLTALVDAPKHLWHPVIVGVDEAHTSCPEHGFGEAESSGAVIDLCTRGRKRGFMALLGTQRIAALNKNAAAQLKNKIIGSASLDTDMKRAGDELGFDKESRKKLRQLEPGNFFVFGPAISREIVKVKVGQVVTTHPEAGSSLAAIVPPPPAKIKAMLSKLADLPAEAEEKAKTVAELRAEITTLKRQLAAQPKPEPAKPLPPVEVSVLTANDKKRITKLVSAFDALYGAAESHYSELQNLSKATNDLKPEITSLKRILEPVQTVRLPLPQVPQRIREHVAQRASGIAAPEQGRRVAGVRDNGGLSKCERAMLIAIAQHTDEGLTKREVITHADYVASGTTATAFARFNREGWMQDEGNRLRITDAGLAVLGDFEQLPTGIDLRNRILTSPKLNMCERKMIKVIFDAWPEEIQKGEVVAQSGYVPSGTTATAFSRFGRLGWIDKMGGGRVRAKAKLFNE